LEANILSAADVFGALTSLRDYPKHDETGNSPDCDRMSVTQPLDNLDKGAGSHFDVEVAAAFKQCLTHDELPG